MKQPQPSPSTATTWPDPGTWTEPVRVPAPPAEQETPLRTGNAVVDALEASFARRAAR